MSELTVQEESSVTAEQKLSDLKSQPSNAGTVETISTVGHVLSTGLAVGGAVAAGACYAVPLAVGIPCAVVGGYIAHELDLGGKIVDLIGKPRMAGKGRLPACKEHAIAHNHPLIGGICSLVGGLLAGLLVAAAVAAVIGTGGAAAPLVVALAVGAASGAAGGLVGGFVGALISDIGSNWATISGMIAKGSPDVFFEKRRVARVTDPVKCDQHSKPPQIMEGSETIFINNLPLARIRHKISCSAVVQEGCKTIFADNTTKAYGTPDAELSVLEQLGLSIFEVGLSISAVRKGGLVNRLLRWALGEPIDAATGDYASYRTDFKYPGILPLQLTRAYSGKERVYGLLGTKWICNWSQRLLYDPEKNTATLEDAEGQRLGYDLERGSEFIARNLKAPYYHLKGNRKRARLFDSRTQQTLIFTTSDDSPYTGLLTSIEDRNDNLIEFHYTGKHLSRVVLSIGVAFNISTTAEGYLKNLTKEGEFEPLVRYEYGADGAITDVHSLFEGEYHYGYTEQGWLNHWHDSGSTSVDLDYDGYGRVIATRTPDGMFNDRFIYNPDEHKTLYIDATGACRTLWFNKDNLLIREEDAFGQITRHTWDGLERKQSSTDALGRITYYEYDMLGLLTAETDWAGLATNYIYDENGLLTNVKHPDGRHSCWEYDDRGNMVAAVFPDGRAFRYSYDVHGNLLYEIGPDGAFSRWEYTGRGRIVAWIDPLGRRTTFEMDPWLRPTAITDPAGHTTRYIYEPAPDNPRVDLSRIVHPDGGEERFSYDKEGQLSKHVGAAGQTNLYKHGSFDLLRTVIDAKGCITSMDYDGAARLRQITNAAGQKWTYSYDPAGRLAAETDWAGRQTTYTWDAVGRVATKRLPDGIEQHVNWDEKDRFVSIRTENMCIAYEYDDADRLVRAATYGVNGDVPESDVRLVYDGKGWLKQEIQNGVVIDFQYDAAGRLIGRKSPSGETVLAYDPLGLLSGYTSNGHGLAFHRNALGLETERRHNRSDQGLITFTLTQDFDPCGRLRTQVAGRGRSYVHPDYPELPRMELAGLVSRNYKWDKSGRLVGVKDNVRGTTSYRYDPRDQVSKVERRMGQSTRIGSELYEYDSLMNMVQSDGQWHQYDKDCVASVGGTTYRYDPRGRVVEKKSVKKGFRPKTWRFIWDDFDRLTETYTSDGGHWRYSYDAFGRRIKKECVKAADPRSEHSVTYIWHGATLAEEWKTHAGNSQPTQVSRWHFEPGTFNPIAKEILPVGAEKAGEPQFYPIVTDHLGTPKEIFNVDGQCLWQSEHTLWGRASVVWQKKQEGTPFPMVNCNLRFQNQWEDEETGLYYNMHRYYDPDNGQYLSQDPIKLHGGFRTHGYVHDPMQWIDPCGLGSWKDDSSYHGPKPEYEDPGYHDPKSPNFRGGGSKTTPLPSDAEGVYKRAVPADPEGKIWYGRNAEGDIYRYQSHSPGKVHWNGRENSPRGLKGIPNWIRKRFDEMTKKGKC